MKYKVLFIIFLIISFFGIIVLGIIKDEIEDYENNKYFTILSSLDNKVFDEELYTYANNNKIDLIIEHEDDLEAIELLKENPKHYDAIWLSNSTWVYMLDGVKTSGSKSININPVVFGIKKSKAE